MSFVLRLQSICPDLQEDLLTITSSNKLLLGHVIPQDWPYIKGPAIPLALDPGFPDSSSSSGPLHTAAETGI